MPRRITEVDLRFQVDGLMGEHPRIVERGLALAVDDFFGRLRRHRQQFLPGLRRYQALRQEIVAREREALRLAEFKPRPLSSFVRNKLINDVYLGVIGDNLAKQMGTVGENKRTDLMGLLMLISPPGYGKTTLMEYVAHRLGLIFMKINGPALGHEVRSLDPGQAPDATSRQELEKLNLALEMGNNVMLYVDDIQHTHPEFLQKFISLCDGTRRGGRGVEGPDQDLRHAWAEVLRGDGGQPYTGVRRGLRIPDMLANRADIYNLGDTLSGMQEAFSLSYIENALTSNRFSRRWPPATWPTSIASSPRPRASRSPATSWPTATAVPRSTRSAAPCNASCRCATWCSRSTSGTSPAPPRPTSTAASRRSSCRAAYRNMNKMAEKISAVMNDAELLQLIADHYQGESQLLTTGAEENLLKLAELRGNQSPEQAERWAQIKRDFLRNKSMGGSDADVGGRLVAQLNDCMESVRGLAREPQPVQPAPWNELLAGLRQLGQGAPALNVEVTAPAQPGVQQVLESLAAACRTVSLPLIKVMDRKIDVDLRTHNRINEISSRLDELGLLLGGEQRPLENDQP